MTVFFDIDDTLYDRSTPFSEAVEAFFRSFDGDAQLAYAAVDRRGNEVFHASQRGDISMDEMYIYRYCRGFADVGFRISPEEALGFQKVYRSCQQKIRTSAVMEELLRYCHLHADRLGIITNGPSDKQWDKVRSLGLLSYIPEELVVISGDVHVDKPDPGIFQIAGGRCGEAPDRILFVGDSPSHDILPAAALGWRTLWFNRHGLPDRFPSGVPDARADSEEELLQVIRDLLP